MLAGMGTPFFDRNLFKKLEDEIKAAKEKLSNALLPKGVKDFDKLDKFPEQASENVVNFLASQIKDLTKTEKGQAKYTAKIDEITQKLILDILEKARAAGEKSLKNPQDFNKRMLDEYAPAADMQAIAGSDNTENLFRYAQEKAAKKAHELEIQYGLAEGTVGAYAQVFGLLADADLNKLFSLADAINAIETTSFTDISGANIPSFDARGFGRVNRGDGASRLRFPEKMGLDIESQILANPAILENLIKTKPDALEKKVEALLIQRAREVGRELLPEETIEALQLALVQSFVGQVRYAKVDEQDINEAQGKIAKKIAAIHMAGKLASDAYAKALGAKTVAYRVGLGTQELDAAKVTAERARIELLKLRNNYRYAVQDLTGVVGSKNIKEPFQSFPNVRTREDKAADKEYGQALAVAIAKHEARLKDLEAAFAGVTRAQVIGPEETALNRSQGQATAVRIAKKRDRDRALVTPDLLDEAYAENTAFDFKKARASSGVLGAAMRKRIAAKIETIEQQIDEAAVQEAKKPAAAAPQPMADQSLTGDAWSSQMRSKLIAAKSASERPFSVAMDTEFNYATKQVLNEVSAVFKNAAGEFEQAISFISIPKDVEGLKRRLGPDETDAEYAARATTADKLRQRAETLGIGADQIGGTGNEKVDFQILHKNVSQMVKFLLLLQELNIPITGSNFKGADGSSITRLIEYVNSIAKNYDVDALPVPTNIKAGLFESDKSFKEFAPKVPGLDAVLGANGSAKLQTLISGIAKLENAPGGGSGADWLKKYESVFRMDENGKPKVRLDGTKTMEAHFAAADAVMSVIVQDFYDEVTRQGHQAAREAQLPQMAPGLPGKASAGNGGSGKPPVTPAAAAAGDEDPMANRAASSIQKTFHTAREYNMLLAGLTEEERTIIREKLKLIKSDEEQIKISASLLQKESELKNKTNELKKLKLSAPDSAEYKAAREEVKDLNLEIIKLTNAGRKNETEVVSRTLAQGRYKEMQEQVRLNTSKQIDQQNQLKLAGKEFTTQVKINAREQIEAQKAVQKANAQQVNQ